VLNIFHGAPRGLANTKDSKIYSDGKTSVKSEHARVCKTFNVLQTRACHMKKTVFVSVET